MNQKLSAALNNISAFSREELELISPFIEHKIFKKNECLLQEGELCTTMFLVESGILRNYYNKDGNDINLGFTFEGQFTTNLQAYRNRGPSSIIIEAVEKTSAWIIKSRALSDEYRSLPAIATFIRRLIIRMLMVTEEHHNMMMMNAPADRYHYLLEKKPELIQRIPLTQLASYIGITRETLSRIRSNKY